MTLRRTESSSEILASVSQVNITQSQIGEIPEVASTISNANVLVTSLEKASLNSSEVFSVVTDAQITYDSE
jgi:hypothetical protein